MKTENLSRNWRFEARNNDQAELYLYDQIGSDGFGEGVTAKAFVSDLHKLGPVSKITVHLNSPGGSVADGIAIFNALVAHPAKIETRIDSMAASIASLVAMAGDKVLMCANGLLMVHLPHVSLFGAEASELRRMAGVLDTATTNLISGYGRHSKIGADRIKELMVAETWLDANQAVELGFVDEILSQEGDLAGVAAKADLSKFRNVPPGLIAAKVKPKDDPYVPLETRPLEQLDASVERMRLQHRLQRLRE